MNNIDKQYTDLVKDILENGHIKSDRTGTGTISVYGRTIRHKMSDGFPLLTTKKMYFKGIVTELLWFLRGETNIKSLVDNDCHIWDGDAYKSYKTKIIKMVESWDAKYHEVLKSEANGNRPYTQEEFIERIKTDDKFAEKWGELGFIYGKQWRAWNNYMGDEVAYNGFEMWNKPIDQIKNSINLLRTDPDSRRNIVSAWAVHDLPAMVLPPCHMMFQFYTRELSLDERAKLHPTPGIFYNVHGYTISIGDCIEDCVDDTRNYIRQILDEANIPKRAISLMWYQRSCDVPLGLPFNIASYALLLEIYAKMVNMVPDELIGNLGDTHIYLNQIDAVNKQISRPYTHDERVVLLKEAMGHDEYNSAVSDLVPFGGGMSEYFNIYKIPTMTRVPYELPILTTGKTDAFFRALSEDVSLFSHLDPDNFAVTGYKSHPAIKIPLSN